MIQRGRRVIPGTYRPLEVKRHRDGRAGGDGGGVGTEDLGQRGAVGAWRLRVDDVLRVLETHAEKYLTVLRRGPTDAAGTGEGVDLQLEEPGGEDLRGQGGRQRRDKPSAAGMKTRNVEEQHKTRKHTFSRENAPRVFISVWRLNSNSLHPAKTSNTEEDVGALRVNTHISKAAQKAAA